MSPSVADKTPQNLANMKLYALKGKIIYTIKYFKVLIHNYQAKNTDQYNPANYTYPVVIAIH